MRKTVTILFLLSLLTIISVMGIALAEAKYRDGSFVGLVKDPEHGDTVVEVVIKQGKIDEVNIIMPTEKFVKDENYPPALEAYRTIPKLIVQKQSPDVDVVSKATGVSKKYIQAVKMALENARPKEGALPKGAKGHDGTYVGVAKDPKHGDVVVEVVIKGGKMVAVNVIQPTAEYIKSYQYAPGREAYKEIPKRILEAQSPDVDVYSKATSSSKKYMAAVKHALEQAQ